MLVPSPSGLSVNFLSFAFTCELRATMQYSAAAGAGGAAGEGTAAAAAAAAAATVPYYSSIPHVTHSIHAASSPPIRVSLVAAGAFTPTPPPCPSCCIPQHNRPPIIFSTQILFEFRLIITLRRYQLLLMHKRS